MAKKLDLEHKAITSSEVHFVLKACNVITPDYRTNAKWRLYFRILWETGIRPSEALALQAKDIQPDKIYIRRLKKRGTHPEDWVPIREDLYNEIRQYIERYNIKSRLFPNTIQSAHYIFNKIKMTGTGIRQHLTLHSFRHGFAFNYLSQSKENPALALPQLQRLLGHSSIDTTSVYIKPRMDDIAEVLKKMRF